MGKYIVQRLLSVVLTLLCIVTLTFFLMHAIPGGPFTREKPLPEAIVKALNEKYHLDDPVYQQYFDYLKDLLHGDMGPSFIHKNRTVNEMLGNGFPMTARLGVVSILLTIALAIPLGMIAALKRGRWQDTTIMILATLGVCMPSFVVATLLIYVFCIKLGWFNVISGSLDSLKAYILPVIALSGSSIAYIVRLMRSSMLDSLGQDYIRTARAKGLSEVRVMMKHAFKNAVIPVITYLGPMAAGVLTGSFVIEKMFTIPGMGKFYVESINSRDYTMIMGATIFYATLLVILNFVVDLAYSAVDPRIKLSSVKEG
jgi:oligopeptide transport system permease protein